MAPTHLVSHPCDTMQRPGELDLLASFVRFLGRPGGIDGFVRGDFSPFETSASPAILADGFVLEILSTALAHRSGPITREDHCMTHRLTLVQDEYRLERIHRLHASTDGWDREVKTALFRRTGNQAIHHAMAFWTRRPA